MFYQQLVLNTQLYSTHLEFMYSFVMNGTRFKTKWLPDYNSHRQ